MLYDREKNHLIHLVNLGRLYIEGERVRRVLARVEGEQKRILDLGMFVSICMKQYIDVACLTGTGVGAWSISPFHRDDMF